ncbi:hypothetical protein J5N97_020548 [Dioscorea zingiberensis]|uniref:RING-type domain-containing protein n=1 Tax=Dioscorea zingiberensis TaxID=325984 RepID=A0A9D5HDI9_9LILI|nr:hypothetical protein J5N97_020548 [Dioscorea zingiberensis]
MAASRARLTLSDQLSILDSSKLRDLLKTRDDNGTRRGSLTLAAVLASEKNTASVAGTRRLLDILRDEEGSSDVAAAVPRDGTPNHVPPAQRRDPSSETSQAAPAVAQPVRVSLMALLEQADRVGGGGGGGVGDEVEEVEMVGERERAGTQCCVCMMRHKGSAFIPCGHTFCRPCSRELWVTRGSCPLCNGFILEILDIF